MAIIAALLGAAVLVFNALVLFDMISVWTTKLPSGVPKPDMPGSVMLNMIMRGLAITLLLFGVILVLVRKVAGAVLLALGALVTTAMIVMDPFTIFGPGIEGATKALNTNEFGFYFKFVFHDSQLAAMHVFDRNNLQWIGRMLCLFSAPLALIVSILPPTLNYLRADTQPAYGYPQQGW